MLCYGPPLLHYQAMAGNRILDEVERTLRVAGRGWLAAGRATVLAAAPGRLDVMGGIADYSGALVLEGTIGALTAVAVQRRDDALLRVRTTGPEAARLARTEFTLPLSRLARSSVSDQDNGASATAGVTVRRSTATSYEAVRAAFPPDARWAAYVLGVFYVLLAEGEVDSLAHGADVLVAGTVPMGAGVASSAALEVATMRAVATLLSAPVAGLRLAVLCQLVENRVAGAPCGIMDQVTCALGRAGQLLALRCRPHEVLGWQAPPPGFGFAGLDSGVKHAVGGTRYARARCAAFMGRRIIRAALEANGEDPARAAYLCAIRPAEYRARFRHRLPPRLRGRDFLAQWGETGDDATTVDPEALYPVRGATEHPIYEQARVEQFLALLRAAGEPDAPSEQRRAAMRRAARLMYGSHRSYSRRCGLGARETDLLVRLVRAAGPEQGLYGAKITGGGSGGTVAVLLETDPDGRPAPHAARALEVLAACYAQQVGHPPGLITGSRPGAEEIGTRTVRW